YGYVRPARVVLDTNTAAATVAPPGVPSVGRVPTGAKTGVRPADNGCHKSRPHQCETMGGGGGGFVAAGDVATAGSGAAAGTEKEGNAESGDGLEAGGVTTAAAGGEGEAEEEEEEEEENATADGAVTAAEGAASGTGGVSTPTRATTTLAVPEEGGEEEEDDDDEPGSPPTPASPGLADWEITEGAREMLQRAQPQQQQQQQQQQDQSERSSSGGDATAAAPRSLEELLAENSSLSSGGSRGGNSGGGGGGGGRRSSVSSNWSPPPSSTAEAALSRSSSRRQQRRRSCGIGVGVGRVDDGTPSESSGGAGAADTPTTGGGRMSPGGGSSSNPPTPARMKFEGWTPEERDPAGAGGNRVSSSGTPSLGFRSPLNSDVTASLIETALSVGKRQDVTSTPSEEVAYHLGSEITRPKPAPIKRLSLQGNESSVTGSLPKGPRGDFWGNASPESSVEASSRENTAEHRPDPSHSPETPATPRMLSPRFLAESTSGGDHTGRGGGAASACPSDRVTRSASRAVNPAAPKATDGPGGEVDANDNTDWCGSDHDSRGSSDGFDSDACPTPELSSPLRSATISVRDLQVLTPSAKVNTGDRGGGGGGGYSGGSTYNYDDDDDDDSEQCPTPELSSPLRSTGSAALCRRRLEEADGDGGRGDDEVAGVGCSSGPLDFVSEEEYARAPKFLTIQVSRSVLNDTIGNLNAYAAPRLASPSELLLTVDEIMGIIDKGELSRTLLLSAAHLKRIEV
ncbi:unnamed protein product, partial [Ectocarpus sp. 13 AM-2016]